MADCCAVQRGGDPRGHSPDCPIALRGGDLVGYARVSTLDQGNLAQVDALKAAGCVRVFVEYASAADRARPELGACLAYLRPGDTLVVVRFDRLARDLGHLLEIAAGLDAGGMQLRSLTEAIDTSTPGGVLVFQVFGAIAQFERELGRMRTLEGLAAARARGRRGGRPPVLTPDKIRAAAELRAGGHSIGAIAKTLGVSKSPVQRALAALDRYESN